MTPTPLTPAQRRSRCAGGLFAGLALLTGLTLPFGTTRVTPARPQALAAQSETPPSPVIVRSPRASRGGIRTAPMHYVQRTVAVGPSFSGRASWYGGSFQGRRTANGERFDTHELTAASRTLPFGTHLRVCRRGPQAHCVVVRINDRGPYVGHRVLDLSLAASRAIGSSGVAYVTATPIASRRVAVRPKPHPAPVRAVRRVAVAPAPVLASVSAPAAVEQDHTRSLVVTVGFALLALLGMLRGRRLR